GRFFSAAFSSGATALDLRIGNHGIDVAVSCQGYAFRQLHVGDVEHGTGGQLSQIHFDALGQVTRQAGDFDFGGRVRDHCAVKLHGRRDVAVDEVQRYLGGDALGFAHALEVDVQDLRLVRVPLHGAQQHGLATLAVEDHVQDGGVEFFLAHGMEDFVVVEFDAQRLGGTAVNDGGNTTFAAQAAARTRTLVAARSSVEFHGMLQWGVKGHGPTVECSFWAAPWRSPRP